MSGSKEVSFKSEAASIKDVPIKFVAGLSSDVVSLLQTGQHLTPVGQNTDLPAYLDMPPLYSIESITTQDSAATVNDTAPTINDTAATVNDTASTNSDTANGDQQPTQLDPTQTIEQLIASGVFDSSAGTRAAALMDEHKGDASSFLNFFGLNGDKLVDSIGGTLGGAKNWLNKENLADPSTLKISMTTDTASANFIINSDGSIVCNQPPLSDQTTLTIAVADNLYGLTDLQKTGLKTLTDYLTQSLTKENATGQSLSPAIDDTVTSMLAQTSPFTNPSNQPTPSDSTDPGSGNSYGGSNGAGTGSGGDSGGGGGGGGGGGSAGGGGGGGDSYGGNGGGDSSQAYQPGVSIPGDEVVIPQDTPSQQWLKAVDATVNGNGLGSDRYTAVSDPGTNGYNVGAYNTSAIGMANWIFGLTDAELDDIEDDEYDDEDDSNDSTNNNSTTNDKSSKDKNGKNKGKNGAAQHRDHKHVFRRGTASRLRHLRDELRAFQKEHGKDAGVMSQDNHLTQDGLKAFLAQRPKSQTQDDDGLVKLLTDMSNPSPDSKSLVQADLSAAFDATKTNQDTSFDPALQELMANDQLKVYGAIYKEKNPGADLSDPAQLTKAAGVLMLAMHLEHYPSDDEITLDSADANGIINTTNSDIKPRQPNRQGIGNFSPLGQFDSNLGQNMFAINTGMQGTPGGFAYDGTVSTDTLIQARILSAANQGRGNQMWRLIANGSSGAVEGCAASVSAVLDAAGVANVHELTVTGLEQQLLNQGWTVDTVARPGDVVVGYGGKSSGHTGIVGTDGTVYDNKSFEGSDVSGKWQQESLDYFQNWNTVKFLRPPAHFNTYGFPPGQCTYWAAMNHPTYFANGADYGNAYQWIDSAHKFGIKTTDIPSVGAIVVYKNGNNGYNPEYGHVAIVTAVSGNTYTISEMNYNGDGRVQMRTITWPDSAVEGFIP